MLITPRGKWEAEGGAGENLRRENQTNKDKINATGKRQNYSKRGFSKQEFWLLLMLITPRGKWEAEGGAGENLRGGNKTNKDIIFIFKRNVIEKKEKNAKVMARR